MFITFTTNPHWPQITSELLQGQTTYDRPDLVIHVFQQHLSLFMKDINFLMGPLLYRICITEFQKCGLPHAHIALCLKNAPITADDIDSFLSTELPREPGWLCNLIQKHMTHCHDAKKNYHRCGWPSKPYQYGFLKLIQQYSNFNERGDYFFLTTTSTISTHITVYYRIL